MEPMAYQLSCSDYLFQVTRSGEPKPIVSYTSPIYLYHIYRKEGATGLIEYMYLNGPEVPVYVKRDRICDAIGILDQSLREALTYDEVTPEYNPEWDRIVTRIYRQLLKIMVEGGLDELGFVYDRRSGESFAVLIVDGETYTYGEYPRDDSLISSNAIYRFITDLSRVERILNELLTKAIGRGFNIEEGIEEWRPGFCR